MVPREFRKRLNILQILATSALTLPTPIILAMLKAPYFIAIMKITHYRKLLVIVTPITMV